VIGSGRRLVLSKERGFVTLVEYVETRSSHAADVGSAGTATRQVKRHDELKGLTGRISLTDYRNAKLRVGCTKATKQIARCSKTRTLGAFSLWIVNALTASCSFLSSLGNHGIRTAPPYADVT
jgi:hypothetical protein